MEIFSALCIGSSIEGRIKSDHADLCQEARWKPANRCAGLSPEDAVQRPLCNKPAHLVLPGMCRRFGFGNAGLSEMSG